MRKSKAYSLFFIAFIILVVFILMQGLSLSVVSALMLIHSVVVLLATIFDAYSEHVKVCLTHASASELAKRWAVCGFETSKI